jgi:hypothetical protein
MKSSETKSNQVSQQVSERQDFEKIEKVKLIAYRLWVARRDSNVKGDAESDYYQAEQILESNKNLKRLLLGSFGFSAVAFVLGRSPSEHYANAMHAVIGLDELANEYELSSKLRERFRPSDALQRVIGNDPHQAS